MLTLFTQTACYNMIDKDFSQWLTEEVYRRGWSFREFAQRARLSSSMVSKVVTGAVLPKWGFCLKVARALDLPPETVFRLAGLLPPESADRSKLREMNHLFTRLSPEDQERFIVLIRAYLKSQESEDV